MREVARVRLRWIGHYLHAEADIVVDADLTLIAAHGIAADAEHQLTHAIPKLATATVHTDPATHPGAHHHTELSHQRRTPTLTPLHPLALGDIFGAITPKMSPKVGWKVGWEW